MCLLIYDPINLILGASFYSILAFKDTKLTNNFLSSVKFGGSQGLVGRGIILDMNRITLALNVGNPAPDL